MARKSRDEFPEYIPPTQSYLIGDHPAITNQFRQENEDGLWGIGTTISIGPDEATNAYMTKSNPWSRESPKNNTW